MPSNTSPKALQTIVDVLAEADGPQRVSKVARAARYSPAYTRRVLTQLLAEGRVHRREVPPADHHIPRSASDKAGDWQLRLGASHEYWLAQKPQPGEEAAMEGFGA